MPAIALISSSDAGDSLGGTMVEIVTLSVVVHGAEPRAHLTLPRSGRRTGEAAHSQEGKRNYTGERIAHEPEDVGVSAHGVRAVILAMTIGLVA